MNKKIRVRNNRASRTFLGVLLALSSIAIVVRGDVSFLTGIGFFVSAIASSICFALLWDN